MRNIILVACLLVSFSCVSQKNEIIAKSIIKMEGKNTNIREFIEIDGYYPIRDSLDFNSYTSCVIFFEDGTWGTFYFKKETSENERKSNMSRCLYGWNEGKPIRWGVDWGVYKIQNDTIIVYSYLQGGLLKPWDIDEIRYKIINRKTIQRVYYRCILKACDNYYITETPWKSFEPWYFTPADYLPSSDCWLKEEKWIWRNEQDWKEYMQKMEQKKIKKK